MNWEELQKEFKHEIVLSDSEYEILEISGDKQIKKDIFLSEVRFKLHVCKTYAFLKREILDNKANYSLRKIVTINNDGMFFSFSSIEGFVEWIKTLEKVVDVCKH